MQMDTKQVALATLRKALVAQAPLARKNVERLRRLRPDDSPSELVSTLDRAYLTAVTASGAGSGAAALVPGVGIPAALADIVAFTEATVLYTLSLAEVHGLDPDDI